MATTSQRAQNFLAKNQTNEALPLAKCPTTKETLTLPRDLHEIYADSTVRGHLQTEFSTLNVIMTFRGRVSDCDIINLNTLSVLNSVWRCPLTYAGYEEECVRYHGLSSTDGNSQRAMKYNSTLFLTISYLGP